VPRQYQTLLNFAPGEISEEFAQRFDLRMTRGGMRSTQNWQLRPAAGISVRPSTVRMTAWQTGMFSSGEADIRLFPLLGKNDDYIIRLRDGENGSTTGIVVADASPTGIVRTAAVLGEWAGSPPRLVLNRVDPGHGGEAVTAVRRWTGLDPVALVPFRRGVMRANRRGGRPDAGMLKALRRVLS